MIEYLAPTLEPYKGCTIIDVHPGACLWSAKLHDFLKPKRHILMEPEERYVEPFVQPLLSKPGSTYRHTYLTGAHPRVYWDNYRKLMADPDMMEPRPMREDDDPKIRNLDTSLLVTGNLWRRYAVRYKASDVEVPNLLVRQMIWAALSNTIFHGSGLVRSLWWSPDQFKTEMMADSIRARSNYNAGLEMGARITEVVGAKSLETYPPPQKAESKRPPQLDVAAANNTFQRTANAGLRVPEARQILQTGREAKDSELKNLKLNPLETHCKTLEDLEEATVEFEKHMDLIFRFFADLAAKQEAKPAHQSRWQQQSKEATKMIATLYSKSIRYHQINDSFNRRVSSLQLMRSDNQRYRSIISIDLELRLLNLEANYAAVRDNVPPDSPALEAFRTRIIAHGDKIVDRINNEIMTPKNYELLKVMRDDLRSFYADPPTLTHDRRLYSPLISHAHEFWPATPMCLLDIMPAERPLALPGLASQAEGAKVVQELLRYLYIGPRLSVVAQLNRMAPNCGNDLCPLVPEITDARKGGRLDPNKVVVRMLSEEMIEGLCRQFLEWPFRPAMWQLALASEKVVQEGEMEEGVDEEEDV